MTLVYTARAMLMVAHVRNLLENEGIACTIRHEFLGSGAGELPPTECWPEVWVDDGDAARARALIAEMTAQEATQQASWTCPVCGEVLDGRFGQCWNCGAMRPEP